MATELEKLIFRLQLDASALRRELKKSGYEVENSSKKMQTSLHSVGTSANKMEKSMLSARAATAVLVASFATSVFAAKKLTASLVSAQFAYDRIVNTLKVVSGTTDGAKREFEFVTKVVKDLGLNLETTGVSYGKLAAAAKGSALEGQGVRDIFEGVAQASVALNLSAEQAAGALNAIQQMISKGNVQAEELRGQLGERLPGALQLTARAMGKTTQEIDKMLERGTLTAAELLPKLAVVLKEQFGNVAAEALGNVRQQTNLLDTAMFELRKGMANSGFLDKYVLALRKITELISDQEFQSGMGTLASLVGDLVVGAAKGTAAVGRLAGEVGDSLRKSDDLTKMRQLIQERGTSVIPQFTVKRGTENEFKDNVQQLIESREQIDRLQQDIIGRSLLALQNYVEGSIQKDKELIASSKNRIASLQEDLSATRQILSAITSQTTEILQRSALASDPTSVVAGTGRKMPVESLQRKHGKVKPADITPLKAPTDPLKQINAEINSQIELMRTRLFFQESSSTLLEGELELTRILNALGTDGVEINAQLGKELINRLAPLKELRDIEAENKRIRDVNETIQQYQAEASSLALIIQGKEKQVELQETLIRLGIDKTKSEESFDEYERIVKVIEATQALRDRLALVNSITQAGERIFDRFGDGMIRSMQQGTDAMESFRNAAVAALYDVQREIFKVVAFDPLKKLAGGFISDFIGNVTGTTTGQLLGGANVPLSSPVSIQGVNPNALGSHFSGFKTHLATGGIIDRPTAFMGAGGPGLMGEAGAEAILPLKRKGGVLGVQASGGSGGGTFITIDARGSNGDVAVEAAVQRGIAKAAPFLIDASVSKVVSDRQRDPRLFSGGSV